MKHLHLTLGFLREQRARLDTSIALLEALVGAEGGNGNGSNGHRGALKTAAAALALHEAQPEEREPEERPARASHAKAPRSGAKRRVMRPLPEVTVPEGLDLRGLPLPEAVPAALRAYRKPIRTRPLAALLVGAGFEWPHASPLTTGVGTWCGGHGRIAAGIKGDALAGWRLRG